MNQAANQIAREQIKEIAERVSAAAAANSPLAIRGGGSKNFYGNPSTGETLEVGAIRGIAAYEPGELFATVYAGTPLSELHRTLAERGQMLAFEPPSFAESATVGGAAACGFSGPRRPSAGALRDFVLGIGVVDGSGDILKFGGEVMKNVAGFDVSRLMAGALGTLGIITHITFKLAPIPPMEATLILEKSAADSIYEINRAIGKGLPITASAYINGKLYARASGSDAAVARTANALGGEKLEKERSAEFWESVREHRHSFFAEGNKLEKGGGNLWRVVAPPLAEELPLGDSMIEWHGAVRWHFSDKKDEEVRAMAEKIGGAATLFRASDSNVGNRFPPLPTTIYKLHKNLKKVFDPSNILNRGRLYDF